ncbi:MAG: hypothetical protein Q8N18_06100 [Opitutaceae bacterium]|nr:hypothetical protein [Opitutaceae bacterium]
MMTATVATAAILRFACTLCSQGCNGTLLPDTLKNVNPTRNVVR